MSYQREWLSIYEGSYNQIYEYLWIGDIDSVREKTTSHFDMVVTVCQDSVEDNVGCTYRHYELADSHHNVEQWGGTTDYDVFAQAAQTVVNGIENEVRTLVHCHSGENRSAAVAIAAYAVANLTSYDFAHTVVNDARPIIDPTELMESHAKRFISETQ